MRRLAALLLLAAALIGCSTVRDARRVVAEQKPGVATGAGATFVGPANSAAPSTQTAERLIAFEPPMPEIPQVVVQSPSPVGPAAPLLPAPRPAWVQERVTTTLGQHQDAAGIVKVAATMSGWSTVKWLGALCILVCAGGILWSHGNPDGYPLVFWKVGGIGVFLMIAGDHPAWLLLLLIPLGFYAVQKLNLIRLP